ncbi:MAG: hypothetical protein AAF204_04735 [Pseudomonadota bacterium]
MNITSREDRDAISHYVIQVNGHDEADFTSVMAAQYSPVQAEFDEAAGIVKAQILVQYASDFEMALEDRFPWDGTEMASTLA